MNNDTAVSEAAERKRLAEQELQAAQLAYHDACGEYERAVLVAREGGRDRQAG